MDTCLYNGFRVSLLPDFFLLHHTKLCIGKESANCMRKEALSIFLRWSTFILIHDILFKVQFCKFIEFATIRSECMHEIYREKANRR